MHTFNILLCELRWPRNKNTPVAMSIPSTQILISNTVLQQKESNPLGEMADSQEYIQYGERRIKET